VIDNSPPVSIRIPKEVFAYIGKVARADDRSAAQQIRLILRQWKEQHERGQA
jgi:hypothetical protein